MASHLIRYTKPQNLEHPELFRPGMGTEAAAPFLRSMVQLLRPKRILEIGAGYTTPFLLDGLINNLRVFDDGNLDSSYFDGYVYDPKIVIIDDMSLGDLNQKPGMSEILSSPIVEFEHGLFQGKANELKVKYGEFDFVWFDCGGPKDYSDFINEYWPICSSYVFFHFTYLNGRPNTNSQIIRAALQESDVIMDIIEPHKSRQGSITIVQKNARQTS